MASLLAGALLGPGRGCWDCATGFLQGLEVPCTRESCASRHWEATQSGSLCRADPAMPRQRCIQKAMSREQALHCNVPIKQGESLLRIPWTGGMRARRGGKGGSGGDETWWADGYRFVWGRLWELRAQELGDSPEELAAQSVVERTLMRCRATLGMLWKYAMGSPGKGKGEVPSGYLLQLSRDGALPFTMRGTIVALRIAEEMGWIPAILHPIQRRLANSGGGPGFHFYIFA